MKFRDTSQEPIPIHRKKIINNIRTMSESSLEKNMNCHKIKEIKY